MSTVSTPPASATGLPPGPRMPRALQALGWARRPLPLLESAHRRFGDIFTLRIRRRSPWVLLSDPEDVRRLFTAGAESQSAGARETNPMLAPLLGPSSMMLLDEPDHMAHRKFMLPSFHGERMKGYGEIMAAVTRREIATWPVGEPFALWPRMQAISMEIIMRAVFGDADTEHLDRLRARLTGLTRWLNNPRRVTLMSAFGPRWLSRDAGFRAVMEPVEEALLEEVRRRRAGGDAGERDDILSMLEQAYDESGSPMSEREMRDELITLLSDGPTATSLAWSFERLLRHPDKLARLREEALDGTDDTYTDAVVKETLRLCPAAPLVMRRLDEPMQLGGYTIPPGLIVAPCVYLIHLREDLYPQPRSFLPERFLDNPAGTYTWIPFGGGVRRCVAASFAQMQMRIVIGTVLSAVDLQAVSSRSEQATRSAIAFVPSQQGRVTVTRRRGVSGDPAGFRNEAQTA